MTMERQDAARRLKATGDEPLEVVNSGTEDWLDRSDPDFHAREAARTMDERHAAIRERRDAAYVSQEGDPIVLLADAVNQLGMVMEEIADHAAQHGYTDENNGRRRAWIKRIQRERERIAELIPS